MEKKYDKAIISGEETGWDCYKAYNNRFKKEIKKAKEGMVERYRMQMRTALFIKMAKEIGHDKQRKEKLERDKNRNGRQMSPRDYTKYMGKLQREAPPIKQVHFITPKDMQGRIKNSIQRCKTKKVIGADGIDIEMLQ